MSEHNHDCGCGHDDCNCGEENLTVTLTLETTRYWNVQFSQFSQLVTDSISHCFH